MDFAVLQKAVQKKIDSMIKESALYEVDTDRECLWNLYLSSFPEGTNPIFKTRTEHDCNCCKNFIRDMGSH